MVEVACIFLNDSIRTSPPEGLHRLDKVDTKGGLVSLGAAAQLGVPYSMLLYERLLGRTFASHRDSVSELIGDILENAIEGVLSQASISFRKTARAQRLEGFDQAPDFVVPNEHNPVVVIEAKLAEDDGTARDKVTRVQHPATLAALGQPPGQRRFQVVACIAGRGFTVRREDMRKLLVATQGKVFPLRRIKDIVQHTNVGLFRSTP